MESWLKSGMVDKFFGWCSEAPLTDFTIAQMRALKFIRDRTRII
jgi:hypothetical protein